MRGRVKYSYLFVIANFFVLTMSSCMLLHRAADVLTTNPKFLLYYRITGVKIQLLVEDSVSNNTIVLTESKLLSRKKLYLKINFIWKPDKEAETSPFPGKAFSKCSRQRITQLDIVVVKPNGDKESLTRELIRLDTTMEYILRPSLRKVSTNFNGIGDVIDKLNSCHPEGNLLYSSWSGNLSWSGIVFISKSNPVTKNGVYKISAAVNFSDSTRVDSEVKLNGKLD